MNFTCNPDYISIDDLELGSKTRIVDDYRGF